MKNFKCLIIYFPALILALTIMTGCGIPQSDYDSLLSEKTSLELEKQTLQNDYKNLEEEHESLQAEKTSLEAEKQTLMANNTQVNDELQNIKTQFSILQEEKESLARSLLEIIGDYDRGQYRGGSIEKNIEALREDEAFVLDLYHMSVCRDTSEDRIFDQLYSRVFTEDARERLKQKTRATGGF